MLSHCGTARFAASLLDELHAFTYPIILGGGTPWLPPGVRVPLELAGVSRLGEVVHLRYRPAR